MTSQSPPPIAVVGIGCRLPGAHGPDEFWRRLRAGHDGVAGISAERIGLGAFDEATVAELAGCRGGFIEGIDLFEPSFFGVSPREATRMDPQLRLLLETTWETLEDAGQPPEALAGTATGVFIGHATADYRDMQESERLMDAYAALASIRALMSGFVSHVFDLRGPSMSVDTACSSSAVAVHSACQSLRSGESDFALAGGVNIVLAPENFLGLSRYGLFAADGRCKFGDARADGFVRSDGVVLVALKTLDRALADSDRIYALILGSAVNNDGRGGGYLGRPSVSGQTQVLRRAFEQAGVKAAEFDYVEAHGTGTPVGDAVELEALGSALGHGRDRPCLVGSVKTNVGHTEAAAGVTGLVKAALCLYHGEVPASLHLDDPNPGVDWSRLPVTVPAELTPLPPRDRPWLAGVNSFGISGTNVHLVLSQAGSPASEPERAGETRLLTLSSHGPQALRDLASAYVDHLTGDGREVALRDICYSAARRQHQPSRLAVVGSSHTEIASRLGDWLAGKADRAVAARPGPLGRTPRIAFVFPGQGAQWIGMGRELLARSAVFRAAVEQCEQAVRREAGWSVFGKLTSGEPLGGVEFVQPVLWAVQVGIAELWRSWGVEPDLVLGHSMGEIAAATVAGALTFRDAAAVICRRSQLAARNSGRGAMAAISLSADQTAEAIADYTDRVSIAVVNSPASTVISGEPTAIAAILSTMEDRGVFCRRLEVQFAAHSPQVDELRDELRACLADVSASPGKVPIHSTVANEVVDGSALDAGYWVRNFREPVWFADSVHTVLRQGTTIFVEISPHPVLVPALEECLESFELDGAAVPSLWRDQPEKASMLSSLGALHTLGYPVPLRRLYGNEARVVSLPTYRWQRERFWISTQRNQNRPKHPLLGRPVPASGQERTWEARLDLHRNPYLAGHQVEGMTAFPGTGLCELTVAAARSLIGDRPITLEDVRITRVLLIRDQPPTMRVRLVPQDDSRWHAEVSSRFGDFDSWTVHGTAWVQVGDRPPSADATLSSIKDSCTEHLSGDEVYQRMTTSGNEWRDQFRGIAEVWRSSGEALARIECPESLDLTSFHFHPALLDACGQAMVAAADDVRTTFVLSGIREVRLFGRPGRQLWSHARLEPSPGRGRLVGDVTAYDEDGNCLLELHGMQFSDPNRPPDLRDWLYEVRWGPSPNLESTMEPSSWAILGDANGLAARLRERLEADGDRVTAVAEARNVVDLRVIDHPDCLPVVDLIHGLTNQRLFLVTQSAQAVSDTAVEPLGATVWGLGRVLMTEHPELRPTLVDVDPGVSVEALYRELTTTGPDNQIALRGEDRFVAALDSYRPTISRPLPIRPGVTYLVTGGLGGVGFEVARWLIAQGATHLLLTGRSEGAPDLPGANVRYRVADVADEDAMRAVLAGNADWPPVRGVFHAAGVVQFGLTAELDAAAMSAVLRPKVQGSLVLDRLFGRLDVFVLFSSLASLLSFPMVGSYAAANAFLDALAHKRRQRGDVALSVNWSVWESLGMAARAEQESLPIMPEGLQGFPAQDGLEILELLLRADATQVAVLIAEWATLTRAHPHTARSPLLRRLGLSPARPVALAGKVPKEQLTRYLVDQLAAMLEIPPERLDPRKPLNQVGLNSLLAIEIRNRAATELGVTLPVVKLLGGYTLAELIEGVEDVS